MGEVYLAHDTRLGRNVAIKSLLGDVLPETPNLLFREARAAAALTHPRIAAIHDVIEFDGRPMIVMEYVPGQSLDQYLRAGPPSVDQAIEWALQIASALSAAHARDIVHCDIKPGNIRVTPDSTIKVLDFGIARIRSLTTARVGEPQSNTSMPTETSAGAAGTLPYMAPEQVLSHPVDPRTDIYALGVVLFEMLAGCRPFEAPDRLDLGAQVLAGSVPPLSKLNAAVPTAVVEAVSRAMARQPAQRYQSADAFAEALTRARHSPLAERTVTPSAAPGVKSIKARRAAVPIVVLAAVTLAGFTLWARRSAAPPVVETLHDAVVAVLPLKNLSGESQNDYLSVGVTDVVTTKLAALSGARVLSTNATAAYRDGNDRVERATRDLGATLVVDGSLQRAGNKLRVTASLLRADSRNIVWSGTFDAAVEDIFSLQRQLTDGLIGGLQTGGALKGGITTKDRVRLGDAPTTNTDAFANFAQGRSFLERPDVPGSLDRGATLLESAIALDPAFALAHAALGETYWAQYQRTRDQAWIDKARQATLEALRLDPEQAGVRYSLAVIYNGTGRTPQAIEELRRAIALQPLADDAHRLLGEITARSGDVDGGVAELRRAVELRPSYWGNYWSLGLTLLNAGRHDDAIPAFRRVTELQPDSARGFQALGTAYHQNGDLNSALEHYQRSITLTPNMGAYSNIGTIFYTREQYADAARAYEQAVALDQGSPTARRNLGDAFEAMGARDKAREAYAKAIELAGIAMKVNPQNARTLALLALCEAKIGTRASAERDIEKAVELAPSDREVLYKRAAVRALAGNSAGALEALATAVSHGYSPTLIASDRDLITLRQTPEFRRITALPPSPSPK
jgi:serine/threonine-protein kinase